MDKNTLTGLVMMGLIIFGFLWFSSSRDARERAAQEQAADQQEQVQDARDGHEADSAAGRASAARAAMDADTLGRQEVADIAALVRRYGRPDSLRAHACTLSVSGATFTADTAGAVTAAVTVPGSAAPMQVGTLTPGMTMDSKSLKALRGAVHDVEVYRAFSPCVGGRQDTVTLHGSRMDVTFSTLGGQISRVVLKKYRNERTDPPHDICLWDGPADNAYGLTFAPAGRRYDTRQFTFRPQVVDDSTVVMTLDLAGGATWAIRYTVHQDDYLVRMAVEQSGMDRVFESNLTTATFGWRQRMGRNEKGRVFEERNSAIYFKYVGDSPDDLSATSDKTKDITERLRWVGFKNQFFSSVVIPDGAFQGGTLDQKVLEDNPSYLKELSMEAPIDYSVTAERPAAFTLYLGPNDYPLLGRLDGAVAALAGTPKDADRDLDLQKLVPLGWGIFGWVNRWIVIPVFTFLGRYVASAGIVILLLTIFIKIILFPFSWKSYMSQAKMRLLAPDIKEINERYPGQENAMTRQQKTMALYSRAGANPMSGCLPMLLQMPVLIAMFSFFPSAIELRGQSFLWVHDLSAPDIILTLPFTIPFYGNGVSLFCLLMTVTNIVYTRTTMASQASASQPGMKWMMYLMPVMFLFWFNDYAAGLSYYYFVSLLITIGQTYLCRHFVDEKKVRAQMAEAAKKPRKKSGFMARLEEAQRQQQAALRAQQAKGKGKR